MRIGFDVIGDIHGHASRLETLLRKLGYELRGSSYTHPNRQAVFVGDFVDRGPEIRRTLQIVRAMVVTGAGYAILGNHEFNALAYNTYVEGRGWLRERNDSNTRQHAETLTQVAYPYPSEWRQWLHWFSGLPLALELDGIRVVHAAWHSEFARVFLHNQPISRELLIAMADTKSVVGIARERLLSGVKISLPEGYYFIGKSGEAKRILRVKWWVEFDENTYREVAFPTSDAVPAVSIPSKLRPSNVECYPLSEAPVFFGHYWLPFAKAPEPVAANIACLDYSVAAGGPLVAYRWSGEQRLLKENFVLA